MSGIEVSNLRKQFRTRKQVVDAIDGVSFSVEPGSMLVLLGPSGCGKTTTLFSLAGLEWPDSGSIAFGDQIIFDAEQNINVQVHRRNVGLVFQSFALWPHMTASKNIAFPLRSSSVNKDDQHRRVKEMGRMVRLDPSLLAKYPGQLSGGQQQRVSLARALIAQPNVVLFDEPLSSLDALLREELRTELRTLHQRLEFTGVYVTHDLAEAMALGDLVAVMGNGKIQQIGSPLEVFDNPSSVATARLVGLRRVCTLVQEDGVIRSLDGVLHGVAPEFPDGESRIDVFARPKQLEIGSNIDHEDGALRLGNGQIIAASNLGSQIEYVVDLDGHDVRVVRPSLPKPAWRIDDVVSIEMPADACYYGERSGPRRLVGNRFQAVSAEQNLQKYEGTAQLADRAASFS